MNTVNIFEHLYQTQGITSQRRYPNEALIGFLAGLYAGLSSNERKQIRVLELGCGSGANLWYVAKEGFTAYGIDFAPSGVDLCLKVLNEWEVNASVQVADMTSLPFSDGSFDVIFDVVSMQHLTIEQHQQAFQEVRRCLKQDGWFFSYHLAYNNEIAAVASLLDEFTVKDIPGGFPLAGNGQTCLISLKQWKIMLESCCFRNLSLETVKRSYGQQTFYLEYLISAVQR